MFINNKELKIDKNRCSLLSEKGTRPIVAVDESSLPTNRCDQRHGEHRGAAAEDTGEILANR